MALSIVNGFVCFCSCDVSKAKKGENPHPSHDPDKTGHDKKDASSTRADQPAVIFGGTLGDRTNANTVKSVDSTQPPDSAAVWLQSSSVDVLV